MQSSVRIPRNPIFSSVTTSGLTTNELTIGSSVNNISSDTGLLPGVDSSLSTQLAVKTYVDSGVTADLAAHEANSTTAHFNQNLKSSGSPVFKRVLGSMGFYQARTLSPFGWWRPFNFIGNSSSGIFYALSCFGKIATSDSFMKHFTLTVDPFDGAKHYDHYNLAGSQTNQPRVVMFHKLNTNVVYIQTDNDTTRCFIEEEPVQTPTDWSYLGSAALPSDIDGTWAITFDSDDTVNFPVNADASFGECNVLDRYSQNYTDPLFKDIAPPSKSPTINLQDLMFPARGVHAVFRSVLTVPVPVAPTDGVLVPIDTIIYQTSAYGANDIDLLAANVIRFNRKAIYNVGITAQTFNVIAASRDTVSWFETSPDNVVWTPAVSQRRITNTGGYSPSSNSGNFAIPVVPLYFRFKAAAANGAAGNIQFQVAPPFATATLGNITGFSVQVAVTEIGLNLSAMTQWIP